jgi:L-aminopeptidase/D-esterase-like protein
VQVGPARVPIVPAAILFDLYTGDPRIRPDAAAGYAACVAASEATPAEGNVGAGAGAAVGKLLGFDRAMKGGIGTASVVAGGITVGAIVAVNAVGDVVDPASGRIVAGARGADGRTRVGAMDAIRRGDPIAALQPAANTTLGIVATDARLTKAEAGKLAQMAHDGLARTINPVHTASDGDTVFALSTGASGLAAGMTVLGALAADALATAVLRAVRAATTVRGPGLPTLPAARDYDDS